MYWPYSSVVRSLVKMGVVMVEMPFCIKEQIKNQKDALTAIGILSYLLFINLNIAFLSNSSVYFLSLHPKTPAFIMTCPLLFRGRRHVIAIANREYLVPLARHGKLSIPEEQFCSFRKRFLWIDVVSGISWIERSNEIRMADAFYSLIIFIVPIIIDSMYFSVQRQQQMHQPMLKFYRVPVCVRSA